jgi:protein-S-isoprenylcysteine O-methyltransferase Ste14
MWKNRLARWFKPRFAILYPLAAWAIIFGCAAPASIAGAAWLIAPGLAIRSWANCYAVKMDKLTTCGPYAYMRHPLYAGSFLVIAGFLVMLNVHWAGILLCLGVVIGIVYGITVKKEEKMLLDKFGGEYTAYRKKVPAFFPTFFAYRGGQRWPFSAERYFRSQEYKMVLWTAVAVIFFYIKWALLTEKAGFNGKVIIWAFIALLLVSVDLMGEFLRKRPKA